MAPRLLIVDDEKNIRDGIGDALSRDGFSVLTAGSGEEALEIVRGRGIDLIITDLRMLGISGTELMDEVRRIDPGVPIIILTAHGTVENAVECMRKGAYHYLIKPVNLKELSLIVSRALSWSALEKENEELHNRLNNRYGIENIIGHSSAMERVFEIVKTVAPTKANVLITGESGTGKELIAAAIHALSDRGKQPLITVHCSALAPGLLESELFGHEKGSFTGATRQHYGRFELANHGTIFLDEIGDIDAVIQVKLLRVIQEKAFERVGGESTISVDTRIITATNKDLHELVRQEKFREDLYYRLRVVHINLPPLRERKTDIPILVDSFLREFCRENNRKEKQFDRKAMAVLEDYAWPGNVRELKNVIENLVVLTKNTVIGFRDLPDYIRNERAPEVLRIEPGRTLEEYERDIILTTLKFMEGNKSRAAEVLGIGRKTLHRKLDQYAEIGSK